MFSTTLSGSPLVGGSYNRYHKCIHFEKKKLSSKQTVHKIGKRSIYIELGQKHLNFKIILNVSKLKLKKEFLATDGSTHCSA